MKILVINGSPKGLYSTTLHTCLYLEKKTQKEGWTEYPESIEWSYLHVGKKVKSLEKDFSTALEAIGEADVLVFSYPVYTFIAPYQLHRFIELMKESGADFRGKVATQVTTSKHFYDVTAHRFVEENCHDMCIAVVDGLSADMDDLLTEKGQRQAEDWLHYALWRIGRRDFNKPARPAEPYMASLASVPASGEKSEAKKAIIVADLLPDDEALKAAIDRFVAVFPYKCDVVNIEDFPFLGGCQSCFCCASTGKCIYADGFDDWLRGTIHKHEAIIYAFRIKDHSMGSRFKMYDDRQFCNGHRTVTMGTPFAYIVAGDYEAEANLRLVLEARAQVGGNFLAGVATDAFTGSVTDGRSAFDAAIDHVSDTVCYALEHQLCPPQNFLGVGGMKIFRDLIFQMRGLMRADHKFFKSHGQYDFPQKKLGTSLLMYPVGWLMSSRRIRAKLGSSLNDGMIKKYKEVVDKA